MQAWLVFVHLIGVTGFLLAHGVAVGVVLQLRNQRSAERVRAMLELSRASNRLMYVSMVPLLAGWIWTSIGVFAGIMAAALLIIRPYFRRPRAAVGDPPVTDDEPIRLLNSRQPLGLAAIAFTGLGVIVWLMVLKPF